LLLVTSLTLCLILVACSNLGCGLEVDKANEILESALAHQEKAEEAMQSLATFPHAWQNTLGVAWIGPEQVEAARELVAINRTHLSELTESLNAWRSDLEKIEELNVGGKIKRYANLKLNAIDCNLEYAQGTLSELLDKYGILVEMVAQGRSLEEKNALAEEISLLVVESAEKREECRQLHEEADEYFVKEGLGETKESQER
jgi:hypothetical protein